MDDIEFKKQQSRITEYKDVVSEINELSFMRDFIHRSQHAAIHITSDSFDTKGDEIVLMGENADAVIAAISIALSDRTEELNKYLAEI